MSNKQNLTRALGIGIVATLLSAGAAFAAVATTAVNVRTGPSTGYGVIDTLSPGQQVGISRTSNGWCLVSKPGRDGWVSCAYLSSGRIDRYDGIGSYDGDYYDRGPSVSFSFGFGTPGYYDQRPHRPHRGDHDWPRDHRWPMGSHR